VEPKRISIGARVRARGATGVVVGNGGGGDWIVDVGGTKRGFNAKDIVVLESNPETPSPTDPARRLPNEGQRSRSEMLDDDADKVEERHEGHGEVRDRRTLPLGHPLRLEPQADDDADTVEERHEPRG